MADSYTDVSSQSWFERLGGAIKGVLFGLLLFIAGFPLLWWNEGRAVRTAKGLQEAGGNVHAITPDKVDAATDKQLIHATALATTDETLSDPQFLISLPAIKLKRNVQMYQWIEKETKETKKKIGGGEETTTTYSYDKEWKDQLIDSTKFKKEPTAHQNPASMRFPAKDWQAALVSFGAFKLPPALVGKISNFENLPMTEQSRDKLPSELKEQVRIDKEAFYLPMDPKKATDKATSPEIGDLRITFAAVKPETVSIMTRQLGDTFEPWLASNGTSIDSLMLGTVSAQNMIGELESQNTMLTWILRAVGFLMMAFGISMVFSPLVVLADVLPFLGNMLQMGVGLFAGIFAAFFALITIAIAWLAYRPVLGVGLIVVAVGLVVGFKMLRRKKVQPATT